MDFISKLIGLSQTPTVLFSVFFICFVGYAVGSVQIKGIHLGTAGVFLFALLFGYLCTLPGLEKLPVIGNLAMPDAEDAKVAIFGLISDIGLVLFVASVGCMAGPKFFRDLKANAKSYVPIGALIVLVGATLTVIFAMVPGISPAYATGILSGALTSTPAFSAAKKAVEELAKDQLGLVSLGQAVAYPFGVLGAVLFVQVIPRLLKADMAVERELILKATPTVKEDAASRKKYYSLDTFGFGAFGLTILLGVLLGSVRIPLSGKGFDGPCFSLGMTGGPLLMGLTLSHFGHLGPISLKVDTQSLKSFREFGLMLFLACAGVEGGVVLVEQIQNSSLGIMLVVYGLIAGMIITTAPMVVGYLFARKVCKLPLLNILGSITGGRTSTPALGMLISVAGTDDVAGAYAATYPVALVLIVLASQLINSFMLA